jgi:hypothetical protein
MLQSKMCVPVFRVLASSGGGGVSNPIATDPAAAYRRLGFLPLGL